VKRLGEEDIRTTADLALVHRMRRKPFQDLDLDQQKLEDIMGVLAIDIFMRIP